VCHRHYDASYATSLTMDLQIPCREISLSETSALACSNTPGKR
jgi:hypothetical protein